MSEIPTQDQQEQADKQPDAATSPHRQVVKHVECGEARYKDLFDNAIVGIFQTSPDGHVLNANPALVEIYGYDSAKDFLATVTDISTQVYVNSEDRKTLHQTLVERGKIFNFEVQQYRKDGEIIWSSISARAIKDDRGNVLFYEGMLIDITRRKDAEFELKASQEKLKKALVLAEAANKAKNEFLANLSHEIRTPMNAVIGFAELLAPLITDRKQKNYLEAIKSGGEGLLMIINDILDLSRIESGTLKIQYEPVNIRIIFDEIKTLFSVKLSAKGLNLVEDIDPELPGYLIMDEIRLRQILFNLIGNAIKFTEQGYIKVSVSEENVVQKDHGRRISDVIIAVEDTGIGIPEEEHERIFKSFTQQKDQDPKLFGGTGLGLAISKRLVDMLGGEIRLESKKGRGSQFIITLRNVATSSVSQAHIPAEPAPVNLIFEPATILAVDDVKANLVLIKEYLRDTNVTTISAEDGEQAKLFAKEYKPDLILMDIRMPVMDGYKATQFIKADDELNHIPVIAISAVSLEENSEEFVQTGFQGYLKKPITKASLLHLISDFLESSKQPLPVKKVAKEWQEKSLRILPDLIEKLEETFLPVWQGLNKKPSINAIKLFGKVIKFFGDTIEIKTLKEFGNDLLADVDDFDIDNIQKTLARFPHLIEELKAVLEKYHFTAEEIGRTHQSRLLGLLEEYIIEEGVSIFAESNEKTASILVVDDNPKHIQLIGKTLKEKGYKIEYATSGEDALEWVRQTSFDMILLDVVMPGMNGYEVCEKVKSMPKFKDVPVIFLTVKTDVYDIVKGFKIGVVDYVTKPFNPIELIARVGTHLELKSSRDILKTIALTDGLTTLYNHGYIHERLVQEVNRAKRSKEPLSIVMFDLDNFKLINDTYGHKTGDAILVMAATLIKESIRKEDIAGRYGGEEFLIILPNTKQQGAYLVAEKIRKKIKKYTSTKSETTVTISGGVCSLEGEDANDLITKADRLLYKAKEDGRDCLCINS